MMIAQIRGPRFTRAQRAENLVAARQWRIDNKAYLDELYGPERKDKTACPTCGTKVAR